MMFTLSGQKLPPHSAGARYEERVAGSVRPPPRGGHGEWLPTLRDRVG